MFNLDKEYCFNFAKYYSILLDRSINIEIKGDKQYNKIIIEIIHFP